ncbi:Deleted in malignant brain tumors 1 protein [Bulinus truncatus]|nr:Deleted in malignant brain tumors 1 protein [Bulinus truncatus]
MNRPMDVNGNCLRINVLVAFISALYLETQGGNVRLVNDNFSYQGTVVVFYGNRWGAVCDDGWSTSAAQVVCSMLGYKRDGAVAVSNNGFNALQQNPFWLDDVRCTGTETTLFDCPHRTWGAHDCGIHELAGVKCIPVCQSSFWKCANDQCVSNSSLCDGVQDCTDNSDELNCDLQSKTMVPEITFRLTKPKVWSSSESLNLVGKISRKHKTNTSVLSDCPRLVSLKHSADGYLLRDYTHVTPMTVQSDWFIHMTSR